MQRDPAATVHLGAGDNRALALWVRPSGTGFTRGSKLGPRVQLQPLAQWLLLRVEMVLLIVRFPLGPQPRPVMVFCQGGLKFGEVLGH